MLCVLLNKQKQYHKSVNSVCVFVESDSGHSKSDNGLKLTKVMNEVNGPETSNGITSVLWTPAYVVGTMCWFLVPLLSLFC